MQCIGQMDNFSPWSLQLFLTTDKCCLQKKHAMMSLERAHDIDLFDVFILEFFELRYM